MIDPATMKPKKPMTKDELEEAESAWHRKAHAEDLRCDVCHQYIPYSEREIYYQYHTCDYCQPIIPRKQKLRFSRLCHLQQIKSPTARQVYRVNKENSALAMRLAVKLGQ